MNFKFPWNKSVDKEEKAYLSYDAHRNNLGDILSPIIARHYTEREILRISKRGSQRRDHYLMIGSIAQRITPYSMVWGSGLISDTATCRATPKEIYAVRGPLTRQRLLDQGIECPEVYGDPALLLPEVFAPQKVEKKYDFGIIAHFNDQKDPWLKQSFLQNEKIIQIDVMNKDPYESLKQILECKAILSSSLHGLIIPDAYGIPSLWIEFTKPFEDGHFKFQDYFHSVGRKVEGPIKVNTLKSVADFSPHFESYKIQIDLEKLKQAFPL